MSGFSPDWLALREPVDHRSRDTALASMLGAHLRGRDEVTVVDLGCGAGSNIRATHALLPARQRWTLVDYDPRLLQVARQRLAGWADSCRDDGAGLALVKDGKTIGVDFRHADLNADLAAGLGGPVDLVTASALFDLCSVPFIHRFAAAVAERGSAFYTVLTYNGVQTWTPAHHDDDAMTAAFHAHQRTDKGFGRSAGPDAPQALATAFRAYGYSVREGDSPWQLGAADQSLIDDLSRGFADAVEENGAVPKPAIDAWRGVRRVGAVVGHTDTLALPRTA